MKVVVAGQGGREEYFVNQGDKVSINGVLNFTDEILPNAFNVIVQNDSLYFRLMFLWYKRSWLPKRRIPSV